MWDFVQKATEHDEIVSHSLQHLDVTFERSIDNGYSTAPLGQLLRLLNERISRFNYSKSVELRVMLEKRIETTADFKYRAWPVFRQALQYLSLAIAKLDRFERKRCVRLLVCAEIPQRISHER